MPLCENVRWLICPAFLVQKCFWIEPGAIRRFGADVSIEAGRDVGKGDTALPAGIELCEGLGFADLVRIGLPELISIVGRPAVIERDLARLFLTYLCICFCFCFCLWGCF